MNKTYISGNTVFLSCKFHDRITGEPVNPNLVKLTVYDQGYNPIQTYLSIPHDNNDPIGFYEVEFDTPPNEQETTFYYGWEAEIDGKNAVDRGRFKTKFII